MVLRRTILNSDRVLDKMFFMKKSGHEEFLRLLKQLHATVP